MRAVFFFRTAVRYTPAEKCSALFPFVSANLCVCGFLLFVGPRAYLFLMLLLAGTKYRVRPYKEHNYLAAESDVGRRTPNITSAKMFR